MIDHVGYIDAESKTYSLRIIVFNKPLGMEKITESHLTSLLSLCMMSIQKEMKFYVHGWHRITIERQSDSMSDWVAAISSIPPSMMNTWKISIFQKQISVLGRVSPANIWSKKQRWECTYLLHSWFSVLLLRVALIPYYKQLIDNTIKWVICQQNHYLLNSISIQKHVV